MQAKRLRLHASLLLLAACHGSIGEPGGGKVVHAPTDGSVGPAPTKPPPPPPPPTSTSTEERPTAESVWSPLSVMMVVDPMNVGAMGDGITEDLPALNSAVAALPAEGGIVFFPSGKTFLKSDVWVITKNHVKLWAINREAEVFQAVNGQRRHQAIICRKNTGCGVFGLKLHSDATARFSALEDNQISADGSNLVEVVGNEIDGSAATGVFLYGSKEQYIEGNYIHHTWADHIHHTAGATASWVWNNYIFNEAPSKGDDGVACVTYGVNSPRCGDMEWWRNTVLHTDNGRGYAVIGGNDISIHDNWARGVASAGIIVASESSYKTSASQGIKITGNYVDGCGRIVKSHPGILVSGMAADAGPLRDILLESNISVGTQAGPFRAEGSYENVTNLDSYATGANKSVTSDTGAQPLVDPARETVVMADTSVLRTRDVSHVPEAARRGLYRIHVRRTAADSYQQRFEYVFKGATGSLATYLKERRAAGDLVSDWRNVGDTEYVLLLTAAPLSLPDGMEGVTFREMREGDNDGTLSWLWNRLDKGKY